jgi:restriction system protein
MGRGRDLRRRYRDDSTLATLMEVPRWFFFGVLVFSMIFLLVFGAAIDIVLGRPNLVVTGLGPVLLVVFFGGLFWLSYRERLLRQRRLAQASTAHRLWALMPDEMADLGAELFRLQGYVVTENKRPDLADGGVDFEIAKHSKTWLVQVKHWRQEVGVREVRELWGIVASEGAAGGVLIGTSGFTAQGREFAASKDLKLIDGPEFLRLRSEVVTIPPGAASDRDPLVSEDFALHLGTLHRPTCPECGKPMVVVTRLEDTAIAYQLWGCKSYPACKGTRRFVFPFLPAAEQHGNAKGSPH